MTTTTQTEQSISDLYHEQAIKAGLTYIDGTGSRSIFVGDAAAWTRLDAALAMLPRSASVTCARRRVQWAAQWT